MDTPSTDSADSSADSTADSSAESTADSSAETPPDIVTESKAERKARRRRAAKREAWRRGPGPWVVGAVVGIVAAVPIGWAVQTWQEQRQSDQMAAVDAANDSIPPPGDAVRELLAQDSHVVLDPMVADRVPPADVERAERILADAPVPTYLAYMAGEERSGGYTAGGAVRQWAHGVGEKGHYVIVFADGKASAVGLGYDDPSVSRESASRGQPGAVLERVATEATTWEATPLPVGPREADPFFGSVSGGLLLTLVAATSVVLPLWFLLVYVVGQKRKKAQG